MSHQQGAPCDAPAWGSDSVSRLGHWARVSTGLLGGRSRLGEAAVEMVIHHSNGLHEGIDDRASHETKPVLLEIF